MTQKMRNAIEYWIILGLCLVLIFLIFIFDFIKRARVNEEAQKEAIHINVTGVEIAAVHPPDVAQVRYPALIFAISDLEREGFSERDNGVATDVVIVVLETKTFLHQTARFSIFHKAMDGYRASGYVFKVGPDGLFAQLPDNVVPPAEKDYRLFIVTKVTSLSKITNKIFTSVDEVKKCVTFVVN